MEGEDFPTSNHRATIMATTEQLSFDQLDGLVQEVKSLAQNAVNEGTAMHVVEKELLTKLLQVGHAAIGAMFQSVGNGDVQGNRTLSGLVQ